MRVRAVILSVIASLALLAPVRAAECPDGKQATRPEPAGYALCGSKAGMCMFKVRMCSLTGPVTFSDLQLWQYDQERNTWLRLPFDAGLTRTVDPAEISQADADTVVRNLTDRIGLLWISWKENGRPFSSLVLSGALCNDIMPGPERKGDLIATCIPGKDRGTAAYVPDPELYCRQGAKQRQNHGQ